MIVQNKQEADRMGHRREPGVRDQESVVVKLSSEIGGSAVTFTFYVAADWVCEDSTPLQKLRPIAAITSAASLRLNLQLRILAVLAVAAKWQSGLSGLPKFRGGSIGRYGVDVTTGPHLETCQRCNARKNLYMPVIVVRNGCVKGCSMNDVIVSGNFDDPLEFDERPAKQAGQFR
jgi:hypothetical protein